MPVPRPPPIDMPTQDRPLSTGDRVPATTLPPPDTGWRCRQLYPGRWYAVNERTGETAWLPFTLSLPLAIGRLNPFRGGRDTRPHA